MDEEVDIKRCRQMGIDVVRRITGGGAICMNLN
jgi:lipoate-protein ligase A